MEHKAQKFVERIKKFIIEEKESDIDSTSEK